MTPPVVDETATRWPRWLVWTLVVCVLAAATAIAVGGRLAFDYVRRDDAGLERVERRVVAVLPRGARLIDARVDESSRTRVYVIARPRHEVEAEMRARFSVEDMLFQNDVPGDGPLIALATGPRYYAAIRYLDATSEPTRFEVFTYIED